MSGGVSSPFSASSPPEHRVYREGEWPGNWSERVSNARSSRQLNEDRNNRAASPSPSLSVGSHRIVEEQAQLFTVAQSERSHMAGTGVDQRLALIRAQQERWRRERQAEFDRRDVTDEIRRGLPQDGVSPGRLPSMGGFGVSQNTVRPEEVINRLTERITDRLRDELRSELQRENNTMAERQAASGRRLENYLASEIESHTCPICYELMVPPEFSPTLLFPCGHTFCSKCLAVHTGANQKRTCPYCRQKIASQALNVSLQQLIQNFVAKRERAQRGELQSPALSPGRGPSLISPRPSQSRPSPSTSLQAGDVVDPFEDDEARFSRELRRVDMRCRILRNELLDSEEERKTAENNLSSAEIVLVHLRSEEEEVKERLRRVTAELRAVQAQMEEQNTQKQGLERNLQEAQAKISLIRSTLAPLEQEEEKLRLLLQSVRGGDSPPMYVI